MKIAIYPGSFDPITLGHIDIIKRVNKLFDKVYVAIAINQHKNNLFSQEEKLKLTKESLKEYPKVDVITFNGLLIEAAKIYQANAIIRGIRSVSDYEYESQMAIMNRELNEDYETIFLMPSPQYSFVSSKLIREICSYNGDISAFVTQNVAKSLTSKIKDKQE